MKQVTWKKSCSSVSYCVLRCSQRHLKDFTYRRKTTSRSWSEVCGPAAVYESRLSITREIRPNGQTRPCWSNKNKDSVTLMLISCLKCFQKIIGTCILCYTCKYTNHKRKRHLFAEVLVLPPLKCLPPNQCNKVEWNFFMCWDPPTLLSFRGSRRFSFRARVKIQISYEC